MIFAVPFLASRKPASHSYDSVPASDEETLLDSPGNKEIRVLASPKLIFFDPSLWLTAFAALSIALTIRNLLFIQLRSQTPHVSYVEASIGSPYNGLEKLARNESSPSWPLSSIHYPDFIGATEDSYVHQALGNGSIVRLSSEHTVILQHRVRDYGLQRCALRLRISHMAEQEHATRGYKHIGDDPHLALWRVEDSDVKAVLASFALPVSLPQRKEFLGNIALADVHSAQSSFFGCDSASIITLEIAVACVSDPCIMEFPIIRSSQQQGFWVVQSE